MSINVNSVLRLSEVFVLGFVLSAGLHAAPVTFLNVGTGFDSTGNPLPDGATDPAFQLNYLERLDSNGVRTVVSLGPSMVSVTPNASWLANDSTSRWIWYEPQSDSTRRNVQTATYDQVAVVRVKFNLTDPQVSSARLTGAWAMDDAGWDIILNDQFMNKGTFGFSSYTNFEITGGFRTGENTLDFAIIDNGGYAGFRAAVTGTWDAAVVPEPGSIFLLTGGLACLGLIRLILRSRARQQAA